MRKISLLIVILALGGCTSGATRMFRKCNGGGVECAYPMEINNKVRQEELPQKSDAPTHTGRIIYLWQGGKYNEYFKYEKQ